MINVSYVLCASQLTKHCSSSLGLKRYEHLPYGSQEKFSRMLLEPILNVIVGLFLYRVRSSQILFSISQGVLPAQYVAEKKVHLSHRLNAKKKKNEICDVPLEINEIEKQMDSKKEKDESITFPIPDSMKDFLDSSQYCQSCLNNLGQRYRRIKGDTNRFQENWRNLRENFPENLISKKNIENGFSPLGMVKIAMELNSPGNINESSKGSGADGKLSSSSKIVDNSVANNSDNTNRNNHGNVHIDGNSFSHSTNDIDGGKEYDRDSMGGVIDLARAQIIKISEVLLAQWGKL